MEFSNQLLEKYRTDRRKLLDFLLSSGLIKEIRTPTGPIASISNINLDSISTDYVLHCIKYGGVLDVSHAKELYCDEVFHPILIQKQSGDTFYLLSDPESAGSPPSRVPPPINRIHTEFVESYKPERLYYSTGDKPSLSSRETEIYQQVRSPPSVTTLQHNVDILSLELPALKTGLLDDDLRESAYEVFLACLLFSGVEIQSSEYRKKEKSAKFLSGLKHKRNKSHMETESPERHLKILDTIRLQMQISDVKDALIRRRLTQFASGKSRGQIDVPQLALALLTGISRSEFSSDKSYLHWKNRQANVMEELIFSDHRESENQIIGASLSKIRSAEWDSKMSSSGRSDVLLTIRQIALIFSSTPGRFDIEGETYYWTIGYQLNIRLYEKLLFVVFDILEDGQLLEESEEILLLVKLTWSMLGITHHLHHALFVWVLFQQFIATGETNLLSCAVCEVEKMLSSDVSDDKELAYLKSLTCISVVNGCESSPDLLQLIFLSISSWCDSKLQDYHLHFSQESSLFERIVELGMSTGVQGFVCHRNSQFTGLRIPKEMVIEKITTYVEKSLDAACKRVIDLITVESIKDRIHPLATVASELKLIAKKDMSVFSPILCHWYPKCVLFSVKSLHQFYGERLRPYLKEMTCLTEDARKVLPAAYSLEHCLIELYSSCCEENSLEHHWEFERYPIAEISRSMILDWVVAQHERILEWTGRAFDLEDWEPLSLQQKQAASAVEVFRIIEETVDQFFEWSLPMDITHLQALLSIIFHSLDSYLSKSISQLVGKQHLYPCDPPLTRYKEARFPIAKKKGVERLILDNEIYTHLEGLTTSKLCIRLNTYRYIQEQTCLLEDGIRTSWESVTTFRSQSCSRGTNPNSKDTTADLNGDLVSELFIATLDCIKESAAQAITRTSSFLGAKVVFWDLRDSFLLYLYHGHVEGNRIDGVLPQFDMVLNIVSNLVDAAMRDLVVSSIWKESLEGFMWLLLDGGPSRAFSKEDITLIEEDFNMLKDFFVADGEGLPRSQVDEDAKIAHQILSLLSFQTNSLIQMMMASSEHILVGADSRKYGQRYVGDAQTLIRILCHKKDKEASKFLKKHYHLPASSEYDEGSVEDSSFSSPLVADFLKKSASLRWPDKGNSSFKSIKKRFQATWDIKHIAW